jgi:general nucleoside transport system permease protein
MDVASFCIGLSISALRSATPLLYVLLGETVTERTGVVNLGVEGQMLVGALTGFAVTLNSGNPWLGCMAAVLAGVLLSGVHALLSLGLRANMFASGVAVWMLGGGLTGYFGIPYVGQKIEGFSRLDFFGLETVPVLGDALQQITPTVLLGIVVWPLVGFWLYRTRTGLHWRTVGESAEAATSLGMEPMRIRIRGILVGGALSGLGGAALSVDYTRNWIEWMTAGRGLIAVGLVIAARWNPFLAFPAALLFGGTEALTLRLQTLGVNVSPYLLSTLPYVVCLAVLIYGTRRAQGKGGMPRDLAAVFAKTE